MNEQILQTLLGALATVSVTAVGGLAWMARRGNGHKGNPGNMEPVLVALNVTLTKQTEVLQQMVQLTTVHTAEAALRHTALLTALEHLGRH